MTLQQHALPYLIICLTLFFSSITIAATSTTYIPPQFYLSFEDPANLAKDLMNNVSGVVVGEVDLVPGQVGKAISFNAIDDKIIIADPMAGVEETGEFTLMFWIKADDLSTGGDVFGRPRLNRQGDISLSVGEEGEVLFYLNAQHILPGVVLQQGEWAHLALTFNRVSRSATIYLNGQNVYTYTIPEAVQLFFNTGQEFRLGAGQWSSGSRYFSGQLDEFKFYEVVLSADELALQYATESAAHVNTANSVYPAIETTRISGEIPFHLYVSANGSTALGVENPYDQLDYQWDFGDLHSQDAITHPVTLETVAPNSDQTGPEAAFVYRHPGTYIVSLSAEHTLDGQTDNAEATTIVQVSAWSGETRYFDPEYGSDSNDGLSEASPWQSWDTLVNWLSDGDHRKALIKSGTEMLVDRTLYLDTSSIRIDAYGEGAKPVLLAAPGVSSLIRFKPSGMMEDIVVSNLQLDGNNGNAGSLIYAALLESTSELAHVAFMDMTLTNDDPHDGTIKAKNLISMQNQNGAKIDDIVVWNSVFERNHSHKNGIYMEMKDHFAVVGGYFSGGDGNDLKDHPIYPAGITHALYRWIDFRPTYANNFSINNAAKDDLTLDYTLVDGCSITGGRNGLDFTKHTSRTTGRFNHVIIQNNAFHHLGTPYQGYGLIGGSVERITVRDNLFYGNPLSDIQIVKDDREVSLNLYRNKFWKGPEPTSTLPMLDIQDVYDFDMYENIFVNEGVTGGSTYIASYVMPVIKSWQVDDNQYWAPGIPAPFKLSGTGSLSFTDWQLQGFDVNGLNQDPDFTDPANGQF